MSAEMRLIFDDGDELLKFLRNMGSFEAEEEELEECEVEEVIALGQPSADEDDDTPVAGTSVNQSGSKQSKPLSSDNHTIQVVNYYDAVRHLYFFNGAVYGEGAIIWVPLPYMIYYDASFQYDPDDISQPQVVPLDTGKFNRHNPRVTLDYDYRSAFNLAQTKKEPGSVLICRDGRFYIPCTSFYDYTSERSEYLINFFNVRACDMRSRELWTAVVVHIGNVHNTLAFRYCKGTEIDWLSAVDYLIQFANSDEYEELKLFDSPEESFVKPEPAPAVPPTSSKKSTPAKSKQKKSQ